MNQQSIIPIGSNATYLAGYAFAANEVLGNVDFIFENVGPGTAYIRLKTYDGVSSPSGYADLLPAFTIVPKGTVTKSLSLLSTRLGIFGSGNTRLNVSTAIRNKANLRGAQIDFVTPGKKGYAFDKATNIGEFQSPGYPAVLD